MSISHERRIEIEQAILSELVDIILSKGYSISVNNGGDDNEIEHSVNRAEIVDAASATDEAGIKIYNGLTRCGAFYLVYGNDGYDLIADYSVNTQVEDIINELMPTIDRFEQECMA